MSKNIIICLDGTWNKPDEEDSANSSETNVRILCELCVDDKEKQVVIYDSGVGSKFYNEKSNWIYDKTIGLILKTNDKINGGILGWGLSENIRDAYRELAKVYKSNDKVFIFGFSRGAYTHKR